MERVKFKCLYLCSTLAKNSFILPCFYVSHSIARKKSLEKMYSLRYKNRYSLITMVFVIIILTEY
jgi:hypothetical protein